MVFIWVLRGRCFPQILDALQRAWLSTVLLILDCHPISRICVPSTLSFTYVCYSAYVDTSMDHMRQTWGAVLILENHQRPLDETRVQSAYNWHWPLYRQQRLSEP